MEVLNILLKSKQNCDTERRFCCTKFIFYVVVSFGWVIYHNNCFFFGVYDIVLDMNCLLRIIIVLNTLI